MITQKWKLWCVCSNENHTGGGSSSWDWADEEHASEVSSPSCGLGGDARTVSTSSDDVEDEEEKLSVSASTSRGEEESVADGWVIGRAEGVEDDPIVPSSSSASANGCRQQGHCCCPWSKLWLANHETIQSSWNKWWHIEWATRSPARKVSKHTEQHPWSASDFWSIHALLLLLFLVDGAMEDVIVWISVWASSTIVVSRSVAEQRISSSDSLCKLKNWNSRYRRNRRFWWVWVLILWPQISAGKTIRTSKEQLTRTCFRMARRMIWLRCVFSMAAKVRMLASMRSSSSSSCAACCARRCDRLRDHQQ